MSGKFNFPSAKEALALSHEALTLSQKKVKKKGKRTLLDIYVVDECPAAKSTRKAMSRSSKTEGVLSMDLPVEGFVYLDSSFVYEIDNSLLLPVDHKRLTDIGHVQALE